MSGFFGFQNGVELSDARINRWIYEVYEQVAGGPKNSATRIASGDTSVSAFQWDTCVDIEVSTKNGYCRASVYSGDPLPYFNRNEIFSN